MGQPRAVLLRLYIRYTKSYLLSYHNCGNESVKSQLLMRIKKRFACGFVHGISFTCYQNGWDLIEFWFSHWTCTTTYCGMVHCFFVHRIFLNFYRVKNQVFIEPSGATVSRSQSHVNSTRVANISISTNFYGNNENHLIITSINNLLIRKLFHKIISDLN